MLLNHAKNSGMSYSYKPSRRLTPTDGSLRRSDLHLVPVTVFKGISIVYIIISKGTGIVKWFLGKS